MISPMVKYQFLAFHQDFDDFLGMLKDEGVVHIKQVKKDGDEEKANLKRLFAALKQTKSLFERLYPKTELESTIKFDEFDTTQIDEYLNELIQIEKRIPRLEEEEFHIRFFGDYNPEMLKAIEEKGVYFHLYSVGLGKLDKKWEKYYALEVLFDAGRKTYFSILTASKEAPKIKAQSEDFPSKSIGEISEELKSLKHQKQKILSGLVQYKSNIENYFTQEFLKIEDALQNKNATDQSLNLAFGKVIMLQGWVPKENHEALEIVLNKNNIYFEKEKPTPKEAPPILLKNNAFSSWFEPIAKLFALPNYAEFDLTPFFAPFFLLFFGLCLGDGGYGLLMLIVLLVFKSKIPKEYSGIWKLAVALEFVAIFMGLISGTFFGINLSESQSPLLSALKPIMLTADGLFTLSLVLGAIQIIFGLIIKSLNQNNQYGWQYAISPIGWILLLIGLGSGYFLGFSTLLTALSWLGVALIIVFSDPKGGIGIRIGKGLWDLYGITGFFGDLLSYIRLFALGLAGSILGFVVNDIALSILGSHPIIGPIFFVVMLIVGHGLNIFIASLGAFVHPMRLTFVEFYKNAGFEGGGEPYNPLKKLNSKIQNS